jgi:hypothetical protein
VDFDTDDVTALTGEDEDSEEEVEEAGVVAAGDPGLEPAPDSAEPTGEAEE